MQDDIFACKKYQNIKLTKFTLRDYNIPYGYSPVVLTKKEKLLYPKECSANFIKATRDGFLFAKKDPAQAVSIMKKYLSENDLNNIDLDKCNFQTNRPHLISLN